MFISILTCRKCSAQQVLFLQKYKPGWHAHPHAVWADRPLFSNLLLRMRHDVHLPCTAFKPPLWRPLMILFCPSLICTHLAVGSTSFSLLRSCRGVWSNCCIKTQTYFQNKLSSCSASFSKRHLGSKWRQARKESTNETPSSSSWIRVCHLLVFQILCSPKIPCLYYLLCLSTHPISCWYLAMICGRGMLIL